MSWLITRAFPERVTGVCHRQSGRRCTVRPGHAGIPPLVWLTLRPPPKTCVSDFFMSAGACPAARHWLTPRPPPPKPVCLTSLFRDRNAVMSHSEGLARRRRDYPGQVLTAVPLSRPCRGVEFVSYAFRPCQFVFCEL